MTDAVCINCGRRKLGAWTPCTECEYFPVTPAEMAKSVLLCDHNMSSEELEQVAREIQAGRKPHFDEEAVGALAEEIREAEKHRGGNGCNAIVWTLIGIMLALALALIGYAVIVRPPRWGLLVLFVLALLGAYPALLCVAFLFDLLTKRRESRRRRDPAPPPGEAGPSGRRS